MIRQRRVRAWFGWLAVALAAAGVRADAVHPQDGPHADIRGSIDETGVRFGMMINLAFIDEIAAIGRESADAVHPSEEPMIESALSSFFRDEFIVEIDGVEVEPIISGFEMIRPGIENLGLFPKSGMRGLLRAELVLVYPAKSTPRSVRFVWTAFPPNVLAEPEADGAYPPMTIQAQLSAEGKVMILNFTPAEPEQVWHGLGKTREELFEVVPSVRPKGGVRLPALAIGVAVAGLIALARGASAAGGRTAEAPGRSRRFGWIVAGVALLAIAPAFRAFGLIEVGGDGAGLPTRAEAREIFEPLHANIYRAFDYEQRGEIYDALARSVSGALLEGLYEQVYRSLIMAEEGGAVSRVTAVRLMEVEVLSIGLVDATTPGFTARAKWQVDGVVYHAGHSHERTNEYVAEYTAAKLPEGWRITGNRMLSQQRLDPETGAVVPAVPDGEI